MKDILKITVDSMIANGLTDVTQLLPVIQKMDLSQQDANDIVSYYLEVSQDVAEQEEEIDLPLEELQELRSKMVKVLCEGGQRMDVTLRVLASLLTEPLYRYIEEDPSSLDVTVDTANKIQKFFSDEGINIYAPQTIVALVQLGAGAMIELIDDEDDEEDEEDVDNCACTSEAASDAIALFEAITNIQKSGFSPIEIGKRLNDIKNNVPVPFDEITKLLFESNLVELTGCLD